MTSCVVCHKVLPFNKQHSILAVCSQPCLDAHLLKENVRYMERADPRKFVVSHEPFCSLGGKLSESMHPSPVQPRKVGMFGQ